MKVKPGVTLENLKPPMWYAAGFLECAILFLTGQPLTITDTTRPPDPHSLHDDNLAFDARARTFSPAEKAQLMTWIRQHLDPLGFDTFIHGQGPHIHCEFDPKRGEHLWTRGTL